MSFIAEKIHSQKNSSVSRPFLSRKENNRTPFFQAKLTVGQTDSVYEREADAVADQVMRMEDEHIQPTIAPLDVQRMCSNCEEEKHLQRKEEESSLEKNSEAPPLVSEAIHSSGKSMDEGTRSFMESRFGKDFSNVKIHTGTVAAKSASSINALAYTSGDNVVFNEGQYSPETDSGKKLLAHELTHVVQQGGSNEKINRKEDGEADPCSYSGKGSKDTEIHLNLSKKAVRVFKKSGKTSTHTEFGNLITGPSTEALAEANGWCHMFTVDSKTDGPSPKKKLHNFVVYCGEFGFHSDHWTKNKKGTIEKIPGAESHGCARIPDGGDFEKGDSRKFFNLVSEGDCVRIYKRDFWREPTFANCSGGDKCKV